jgi:hypothetical protein
MEPVGDNWISIDINEGKNDQIIINHAFSPKEDTNQETDLNKMETDAVNLYSPIVDEKGHIIAKHIYTIILPYSY